MGRDFYDHEDRDLSQSFMRTMVRVLQAALPLLHDIDKRVRRLEIQGDNIMASLDETLAAVTAESTVDDSIIALLQGLAAQIAAGGLSPADQAKVDAIFGAAQANAAKVSAAVTANTPPTP